MTEQEQIQAAKKWLQENGLPILLAAAVGGGGYFGWKAYQAHQETKRDEAAALFNDFAETSQSIVPGSSLSADRITTAETIRDTLTEDFDGSLYGVFASAELARISVAVGELDRALQDLRLALEETEDEGMAHILRLRISKVLQEQGDLDGALAELSDPHSAFEALYARQRGSIYQQQGNFESAIAAYEIAVAGIAPVDPNYASLLQLQVEQLRSNLD